MFILQHRNQFKPQTTLSHIYVDGSSKIFCYGLEDTLRPAGIKVLGFTAFPDGVYKVGIRYSPGFKREVIVLYTHSKNGQYWIEKNGVRFDYVLVHGGNDHEDTDSCVLAAYQLIANEPEYRIYGSAEKDIFELVKAKLSAGYDVMWAVVTN